MIKHMLNKILKNIKNITHTTFFIICMLLNYHCIYIEHKISKILSENTYLIM